LNNGSIPSGKALAAGTFRVTVTGLIGAITDPVWTGRWTVTHRLLFKAG
jgi:hypothetical protein